jgi:hypothetical protein
MEHNMNIRAWLEQPTTIHGLQGIVGGVVAAAGLWALGQPEAAAVALTSALAYGMVGLALPDNTQAQADARDAAAKLAGDIARRNVPQAVADAEAGAAKMFSDFQVKTGAGA